MWHAVIFHIIAALKLFDEAIIHIDVDSKNGIIAIANCYSVIKAFRI